jgi:site-specific recombinase XerC
MGITPFLSSFVIPFFCSTRAAGIRLRASATMGKGRKPRMVPVLAQVLRLVAEYVALCPHALAPDQPVFVGTKGGPLSPRIIQLVMERLRGALNLPETATPHAEDRGRG